MDSTSTCITKPLEKGTYRKYNKQPKFILFNHHFIKSNLIHSVEKLTTESFI